LEENAKSKNRRVEIFLSQTEISGTDHMLNLSNYVERQMHTFDASKDLNIKLKKGTEIDISALSLVYENGDVFTGTAHLEVKENFTYADFISEGLQASSDGKLLETGGMLYIQATDELHNELFFKEGNSMTVTYPEQETKEGMELFRGVPMQDGPIDWEVSGRIRISNPARNIRYRRSIEDLLATKILVPDEPQLTFKKLDKYPIEPSKPHDAMKPVEPVLEEITIPNEKKRWSSKKKSKIRLELFEKKLKKYEKQLSYYEKGHTKYLEKLSQYEKSLPEYQAKRKAWLDEVDHRLKQIYIYKSAKQKYIQQKRAQATIDYMKANYDKKDPLALLKIAEQIANGKIELDNNRMEKIHAKAFGDQLKLVAKIKNLSVEHMDRTQIEPPNLVYQIKSILQNKLDEAEYEKTGKVSKKMLNRYVANVSEFGWINCDRFLGVPQNMLANLSIPNANMSVRYYCVFKESRTILSMGRFSKKHSHFDNIPKNQDIKILGFSVIDGIPQMGELEVNLEGNKTVELELKPVTLADVKSALTNLESYSM
ncbi:MAG: hypothetical protein AAGK97_11420, partial [Bacteroidota bacterium]